MILIYLSLIFSVKALSVVEPTYFHDHLMYGPYNQQTYVILWRNSKYTANEILRNKLYSRVPLALKIVPLKIVNETIRYQITAYLYQSKKGFRSTIEKTYHNLENINQNARNVRTICKAFLIKENLTAPLISYRVERRNNTKNYVLRIYDPKYETINKIHAGIAITSLYPNNSVYLVGTKTRNKPNTIYQVLMKSKTHHRSKRGISRRPSHIEDIVEENPPLWDFEEEIDIEDAEVADIMWDNVLVMLEEYSPPMPRPSSPIPELDESLDSPPAEWNQVNENEEIMNAENPNAELEAWLDDVSSISSDDFNAAVEGLTFDLQNMPDVLNNEDTVEADSLIPEEQPGPSNSNQDRPLFEDTSSDEEPREKRIKLSDKQPNENVPKEEDHKQGSNKNEDRNINPPRPDRNNGRSDGGSNRRKTRLDGRNTMPKSLPEIPTALQGSLLGAISAETAIVGKGGILAGGILATTIRGVIGGLVGSKGLSFSNTNQNVSISNTETTNNGTSFIIEVPVNSALQTGTTVEPYNDTEENIYYSDSNVTSTIISQSDDCLSIKIDVPNTVLKQSNCFNGKSSIYGIKSYDMWMEDGENGTNFIIDYELSRLSEKNGWVVFNMNGLKRVTKVNYANVTRFVVENMEPGDYSIQLQTAYGRERNISRPIETSFYYDRMRYAVFTPEERKNMLKDDYGCIIDNKTLQVCTEYLNMILTNQYHIFLESESKALLDTVVEINRDKNCFTLDLNGITLEDDEYSLVYKPIPNIGSSYGILVFSVVGSNISHI